MTDASSIQAENRFAARDPRRIKVFRHSELFRLYGMLRKSMNEESSVWHVGFFARKLPPSRWIRSSDFCVFQLPASAREMLLKIAEQHRELFEFVAPSFERDICLVVARVIAPTESEAAESARHRVGHYIDGVSLVLDEPPPIAKALIVHRAGQPDASLRQFDDKGWLTFAPKNEDELRPWEQRREHLFLRLRPFFEAILEGQWNRYSELFRQILFSARLFRRAAETASYGLEYLCKWMAIEALVVAGIKPKGPAVAGRISSLFPRGQQQAIQTEVAGLWRKRNLIAHEAKAEFFGEAAVENVFEIYIPRLDYLNTAVMVFAIDNVSRATTVAELWSLVDTWTMPTDIVIERPKGAQRIGANNILLNHGVTWPGLGRTLDQEFKSVFEGPST